MSPSIYPKPNYPDAAILSRLALQIKGWGKALGFARVGICDTDLTSEEIKLQTWLDKGYHGEMAYMASHGMMRARPQELHPGTVRVISVRMDYLPPEAGFATNLTDPNLGYISRYAGGRDYHKLIRARLKKLGDHISAELIALGFDAADFRPFVDSAPVLERPLAEKAGIGWTGKHSLILNHDSGSWFFLGELFINLPLPVDIPIQEACNTCVACMTSCPTGAIVEPYVVDGRRCISYLTIELQGAIPEEFRPLMGNRIYGCDDCQLVCPINRQAPLTTEIDFHIRPQLKQPDLLSLFAWSEAEFLKQTEGSAIRRIGHKRWLRNIAVALGNAPANPIILEALTNRQESADVDEMVLEHIQWAIDAQQSRLAASNTLVQQKSRRQTARMVRIIEKGLPRDA
ncbi:tRNA epoxyqueuosine(34) reductase QueG [Shewanella sp. JNE10-2]|uniref:tRNA epoxyqueuosine(34) reductase QueG n=1 Tax=unclassified Shewanella TaxID=196818 RepID=UPI002003406D|nr:MULTISPECIES: tRNA epoxyqueuosine(34) reductase QueG [unclassified Shewanella]MCK7628980.1 tRNA epoxyqueuosine(34) reductase QueG [Shewanella sp. JNE9-1]MCK7644229.1 tRNA epoxyqueuosine(34) reductase QueG [Shewanella sp. JNE3-1]MCK7652132.1 tRNA epoxyqueuosine(34) reductase QueG [Shewanella sp. JNE4-1]UPO28810.1 tRNA epoxyqueuosine(34) reductase QueG [Shewanella sp. JNE10-2]UPO36019.1 tRNA epoxyqueuosine(34) reductase QueG [Shewanella sp. JNE7]